MFLIATVEPGCRFMQMRTWSSGEAGRGKLPKTERVKHSFIASTRSAIEYRSSSTATQFHRSALLAKEMQREKGNKREITAKET
jgi:hypothetical protein